MGGDGGDPAGPPTPRRSRGLPHRRRRPSLPAAASPPADPVVPQRERPAPPGGLPEHRPGVSPLGSPGQPPPPAPPHLGWDHCRSCFDRDAGVYAFLPGGNIQCHCYIISHVIGSSWRIFGSLLCLFNSSLHWSIINCCVHYHHHNHFSNHCGLFSYRLDWIPVGCLVICKEECGSCKTFTKHDGISTFSIFCSSSSPSSAKERRLKL